MLLDQLVSMLTETSQGTGVNLPNFTSEWHGGVVQGKKAQRDNIFNLFSAFFKINSYSLQAEVKNLQKGF